MTGEQHSESGHLAPKRKLKSFLAKQVTYILHELNSLRQQLF